MTNENANKAQGYMRGLKKYGPAEHPTLGTIVVGQGARTEQKGGGNYEVGISSIRPEGVQGVNDFEVKGDGPSKFVYRWPLLGSIASECISDDQDAIDILHDASVIEVEESAADSDVLRFLFSESSTTQSNAKAEPEI